jgi:hypothetical protein
MKRLFIRLTCAAVLLVSFLGCGKSTASKINEEFSYHAVKRYDAPSHGIRLGTIAVPGHTQEVALFLLGIPPDSPEVEGVNNEPPEVPYIFGEMNREPDLDMLVKDHPDLHDQIPHELSLIALAAYNNGGVLVILTKDKVYMASTDAIDDARYAASRGE